MSGKGGSDVDGLQIGIVMTLLAIYVFAIIGTNDLKAMRKTLDAICEATETCVVDDGVYREQILP